MTRKEWKLAYGLARTMLEEARSKDDFDLSYKIGVMAGIPGDWANDWEGQVAAGRAALACAAENQEKNNFPASRVWGY